MNLGFIGLGKMGLNMVKRLVDHDISVVAWNRSEEPRQIAKQAGATIAKSLPDLVKKLDSPRVIWLMVPAGDPVDQVINELKDELEAGDMIVDGGNSHYQDTLRRAKELNKRNIRYLDVGISGGPEGARHGSCLMVGGKAEELKNIEKLFKALAAPQALGYFGQVGAGHFIKMVHNGIEYGMMQAIAEGAAVLKFGQFKLDLAEVFRVYNQEAVIASKLIGWTQSALSKDADLNQIQSKIAASGEGHWTAAEAEKLGIEVPVIESSLKVRDESDQVKPNSKNAFRNKVVSALRGEFGGHPVEKK